MPTTPIDTPYQVITDRILALLEQGTVPWQQPWDSAMGLPRNLFSQRPYRGINVWLLTAMGFPSPFWATFHQVKAAGGTVHKGERGVPVVFWKVYNHEDTETGTVAGAPAGAPPPPSAEAPPPATTPAMEDTRQERLPSADRWDVNEAPASCCLRPRVGEIELMYTMRDVSDAELTSRVQHLVPWVQDFLDQARERQALLDILRQQREATSASAASQATNVPPDLHARIDQAVQLALATHQATSNGTPPPTAGRQRPRRPRA